ncbi:MAG: hypothetical protein O3B13_05285 [Planctomycetota bacterium]|nr:hypothetical protein [Planctomycetota bacterium]MDA1162490.1 hypothetical protein [Planctomycetota bacterium]
MIHSGKSRYLLIVLLAGATVLSGCEEEKLTFTEVKRVNDDLTGSEISTFLEIVDHLPNRKLPPFPKLYLPLPNWNAERTLPVSNLVDSEQQSLSDRWATKHLLDTLPQSRDFDRRLRRKRMTREQFIGLTLSIGAALSRSTVRENQKLENILSKGEQVVLKLRLNSRPFNTMTSESMHAVLHDAAWITRHDRAKRLVSVPDGNVERVLKYWDQLVQLFPDELTRNPFDDIADRLDKQGIPFEELPGNEAFDDLNWDPEQAIVGHDEPLTLDAQSL